MADITDIHPGGTFSCHGDGVVEDSVVLDGDGDGAGEDGDGGNR